MKPPLRTILGSPVSWVLGGFALYYGILCHPVVGVMADDGVYLQSAMALLEGKGYVWASDPHLPAMVKYPPLYPLWLAFWYSFYPVFPDNVWLLKGVNIALSLGCLGLTALVGKRLYGLGCRASVLAMLLVGLNFFWIANAIHLMSEMLYTFISLFIMALLTTPEGGWRYSPSLKRFWSVALLSVLLVYTRTYGVVMMGALFFWYWRCSGLKRALIYAGSCFLAVLPWFFWVTKHPPPVDSLGGWWVMSYNETYTMASMIGILTQGGLENLLLKGIKAFFYSVINTLVPAFSLLVAGWPNDAVVGCSAGLSSFLLLGLVWFGLGLPSFTSLHSWQRVLRALSPAGLYVTFYLAVMPTWFSHDQYERFLLCLLPLLWLMLIHGFAKSLTALSIRLRKGRAGFFVRQLGWAFALGMVCFALAGHPNLFLLRQNGMVINTTVPLWPDFLETTQVIRQKVPADAVLWSPFQSMVSLYTGRSVVGHNLYPQPSAFADKTLIWQDEAFVERVLFQVFSKENVDYLLVVPDMAGMQMAAPMNATTEKLLTYGGNRLALCYQSPHQLFFLFKVQAYTGSPAVPQKPCDF